jgi:putative nucleotidyltransferase with HDIG domain
MRAVSRPEGGFSMQSLSFISDARHGAIDCRHVLADAFSVRVVFLDQLAQADPDTVVLVDIDLNRPLHADALRQWLQRRASHSITIFAVDKGSRVQIVRAHSIGATDIVFRPLDRETVLGKLLHDRSSVQRPSVAFESKTCGVTSGIGVLQNIFLSASDGVPLSPQLIETAGQVLVEQIEEFGFADWVRTVRAHHDRTYQHCLLVSGAAAAFGLQLRFGQADRTRLATAALLHDIGKAKIPLAILDKPERLDIEEMAMIRTHPRLGHEALQSTSGLAPEMLDVVLHHHEYLDGTGYPDGLRGAEILDLTRIVTITDVFSALIEQRPYKRCMPGDKAYEHLLYMGGKLDGDLVRAFKPLSQAQF